MSQQDRDNDREPSLPKPYDFVPLPPGRPRLEKPTGHHRYRADRYSGTLTATILARSPVHVASGLLEPTRDRQYPLVKGVFRSQGIPVPKQLIELMGGAINVESTHGVGSVFWFELVSATAPPLAAS